MAWIQRPELPGELVRVVIDETVHAQAFPPLRSAAVLVEEAVGRMAGFGFIDQGTDLRGTGDSADILDRLERWSPDWRRVLLLYWTGHGLVRPDGELLLVCRDTPPRPRADTRRLVRGRELGALLATKQIPQIILMIDACRCGGGIGKVMEGFIETRDALDIETAMLMNLSVIGSARREEDAREGVFAQSIVDFSDSRGEPELRRERSRELQVSELAGALQGILEAAAGNVQTIDHRSSGLHIPVLLNPHYRPDMADVPAELRADDVVVKGQLAKHFLIKFRGIEVLGDRGWYFTGRRATLRALSEWLDVRAPGVFVLTGPPGCGKSAVLGRLAVLSDGRARALAEQAGAFDPSQSPDVPRDALDVGLHIRGLTLIECVAQMAQALGVEAANARELCRAVADEFHRTGRHRVIMVDALDEAKAPDRTAIVGDLLRPLAEDGQAKVLVGMRPETPDEDGVPDFGRTGAVGLIDGVRQLQKANPAANRIWRLETDPDGDRDIAEYIAQRLLEEAGSPYRGRADDARDAGRTLAERCHRLFLPARAFCRVLVHLAAIPALDRDEGDELFSADLDDLFAADLSRYGPRAGSVRAVLTPLAWAQGKGLPLPVWAVLIRRLRGGDPGPDITEADLPAWIQELAAYLVESGEGGQPVYRLYAEQFAAHLRAGADPATVQAEVTRGLLELVETETGRDWAGANAYLRAHLAAHAEASGGLLSELLADPAFLAFADPAGLSVALGSVDPYQDPYARLYGRVGHRMAGLNPLERSELLQESASRDEPSLLGGVSALPDLVWHGLGSTVAPKAFHRVLRGNAGVPKLAGFARSGGETVVVGYDGSTAHVWDPLNGQRLLTVSRVRSTNGPAVLVPLTADADALAICVPEEIRLIDLGSGAPAGPALHVDGAVSALGFATVEGRRVLAVAAEAGVNLVAPDDGAVLRRVAIARARLIAPVDGAPHLLAIADRTGVTLWDAEADRALRRLETGRPVSALAARATDEGVLIAYATGENNDVHLWSESAGTSSLEGHVRPVRTLALGRSDAGGTALVTGADDGTVLLWDPIRGGNVMLQERAGSIKAVCLASIHGRLALATGAQDRDIRVWDRPPEPQGSNAGSAARTISDVVRSIAFATGGDPIAVTGTATGAIEVRGADGRLLRGWRLTGRVVCTAAGHHSAAAGLVRGRLAVFRWDADTEPTVVRAHDGEVTALTYCSDGLLVSGGAEGVVKFWNAGDLTDRPYSLSLNEGSVNALACGRLPELFVACATNDGTSLLRLADHKLLCRVPATTAAVSSACALGPSGSADESALLVVGDVAGGLRLYAVPSGEPIGRFVGHTGEIRSVAVVRVADRTVVVSASADGTVRIWDPAGFRCIDVWTERAEGLRAAAFHTVGTGLVRALAIGSAVHFARLDRVPGGRGRVG